MTTDDKQTPDPTPALLSAARLSAIREDATLCRDAAAAGMLRPESCDQAVHDAAHRLLGGDAIAMADHLDALTAPVEDGGEVLGFHLFCLYERIPVDGVSWRRWKALNVGYREGVARAALALDAHGYARGMAAGEAERAELRAMLADTNREQGRASAALVAANEEIARLTAERDALQRHYDAAGPDHNLLALLDLYEERATAAERERNEARLAWSAENDEAGTLLGDVERLTAELAEAQAAVSEREARLIDYNAAWSVMSSWLDCREGDDAQRPGERPGVHARRMVEAARREGAREEREACAALLAVVDRITFDAPDDKPNGPGEQAIDDISKALEVERWPFNVRSRVADLNGYMATLCNALADDCRDLKAAADIVRARGEDRPPCPGEGWEWDAFALQWFQPGAKGKAIATSRARGEGQGS